MFYRALHKAEYSFVLVRVISWIAFLGDVKAIHEITRITRTKELAGTKAGLE